MTSIAICRASLVLRLVPSLPFSNAALRLDSAQKLAARSQVRPILEKWRISGGILRKPNNERGNTARLT